MCVTYVKHMRNTPVEFFILPAARHALVVMIDEKKASLNDVLRRASIRLMHSVGRHHETQSEELVVPGEVL